jgi:hypothetical protein
VGKKRSVLEILILSLVAIAVVASMALCYYREWKVEQDMQGLAKTINDTKGSATPTPVNISAADADYILHPLVPTLKEANPNFPDGVTTGCVADGFWEYDFNHALAKEKGLSNEGGGENQTYLKLESVYRAAFNAYLDSAGALAETDQAIAGSTTSYPRITSKKLHVYQRFGSFGRKYIYLENDFYIERLSTDDLDLLKHPTKEDLPAIMEMVERTYKDVIITQGNTALSLTELSYGANPAFSVANGTVVLAIGYDSNASDWTQEEYDKYNDWISQQANSLQTTLTKQLGCTVAVFLNEGLGKVK